MPLYTGKILPGNIYIFANPLFLVSMASEPAEKECNVCGSVVDAEADYCPECGADFSGESRYNY